MGDVYRFKAVTADDLPLLKSWLSTPENLKWWGEPDYELDLIKNDIGNPLINLNLVTLNQVPFAYVQDYCVHDWPQSYFTNFPANTRAIDTFIGVPDMLGEGHGRRYLNAYVRYLFKSGADDVVIDPMAENVRAIQAYQAAGFEKQRIFETSDGPVLLMKFVKPV